MLTRRGFIQLIAATPLVRYLPHGDLLITIPEDSIVFEDVQDVDILGECVFLDGQPIRVIEKMMEIETDIRRVPMGVTAGEFVMYERITPVVHY